MSRRWRAQGHLPAVNKNVASQASNNLRQKLFYSIFISLFVILMDMVLALPPHEVARKWEESAIDRSPGDQDAEV